MKRLDKSLKRQRTDYIDVYLAHAVNDINRLILPRRELQANDGVRVKIAQRPTGPTAKADVTDVVEADGHRQRQAHRARLDYDEVSRTAFINARNNAEHDPEIALLTAGSSDIPVAHEALPTLNYFGVNALPIFDVGVAGLWRLLDRINDIKAFPIVIAAAGMDAALPSVLGGLYPGLIVAVPTSVGYGVAAGGNTALNAILASCASGIVTVNIDNGYSAACVALRILRPQPQRAKTTVTAFQHIKSDLPT